MSDPEANHVVRNVQALAVAAIHLGSECVHVSAEDLYVICCEIDRQARAIEELEIVLEHVARPEFLQDIDGE